MKEIHFHMDFPFDPVNTFKTYDGTKYAIEKGREIIHTTSIANISFDLLDLGYRIFVHRNGRVLECKLGSMDGKYHSPKNVGFFNEHEEKFYNDYADKILRYWDA